MLKKFTAVVAAICLVLTLLPAQLAVRGATAEPLSERAELKLIYLKQTSSDGNTRLEKLDTEAGETLNDILIQSDGTIGRESGIEPGDSFWVGVEISGLNRLPDYQSLYALSFAFVYDTRYFYEPYWDSGEGSAIYMDPDTGDPMFMPTSVDASYAPGLVHEEPNTVVKKLLPAMAQAGNTGDTAVRTSLNPYSATTAYRINYGGIVGWEDTASGIGLSYYTEVPENGGNRTGFYFPYSKYEDNSNVFTQSEGVLGIARLKVKDVPADGAKAIGFSFSNTKTALSYKNSSNTNTSAPDVDVQYYHGEESTAIKDDSTFQYYVKTINEVNPFPVTYTVNYDLNKSDDGIDTNDASWVDGTPLTGTVTDGAKVDFKDTDGNPITDSIIFPSDMAITGWNTAADGSGTTVSKETVINKTNVPELDTDAGTLTLYAQWGPAYDVIFNAGKGEWSDGEKEKIFPVAVGNTFLDNASDEQIGSKLTEAPTYTHTDGKERTLLGWYLKDDDTFTFTEEATETLQTQTTGPITVHAMWEYNSETVTDGVLNFNENSDAATAAIPDEVPYINGDSLESTLGGMPVEPIREDGYKFLGWYSNPSGDGDPLTVSEPINTYLEKYGVTDSTVHARWGYVEEPVTEPPTPTANTVRVTFVTDGYGIEYKYETFNDKYVLYNTNMENMPLNEDIEVPGSYFGGWYTLPDGAGEKVEDGTLIGDNLTDYYTDGDPAGKVLQLYPYVTDKIKLTFNANGGKWSDGNDEKTDEVTYDTPWLTDTETIAGKLGETPTRDDGDYTLVGWYMKDADGTFTTKVTEEMLRANITAPITAYAMWKHTNATTYTLTFDKNTTEAGATEADPRVIGYNSGDTLGGVLGGMPVEPTRGGGYKFLGWYNNKSGDGYRLELTTDIETFMTVDGEVLDTVYARWGYVEDPAPEPPVLEDDTITVHIDLNGGTEYLFEPLNDKYIQYGATISNLPLPEHFTAPAGMIFDGWDTSAAGDGTDIIEGVTEFNDALQADLSTDKEITIYVRWTDKVKITFHGNGGAWASDNAEEKVFTETPGNAWLGADEEISSKLTENPEREGFVFKGWYLMVNNTFTQDPTATLRAPLTQHIDIFAMWDRDPNAEPAPEFKLNFNENYTGTATVTPPVPESILFSTDDTLGGVLGGMPVEPTRDDGYSFLGWYSNPAGDGDPLTLGTDLVGYTGVSSPDNTEATVYAKWGYVDRPEPTDPPTPENPPTPELDTVVVHINLNGATDYPYDPVNDKYIKLGGTISNLPDPADFNPPAGNIFDGWSTSAVSGEGTDVIEGETLFDDNLDPNLSTTKEITIYVKWNDKVTLTFDPNGGTLAGSDGTVTDIPSITLTPGTAVEDIPSTLPSVEKDGYTHAGWFYELTDGTLVQVLDSTDIFESRTLKAKWRTDIKITVATTNFPYNGSGQTPLYVGNYTVTDGADVNVTELENDTTYFNAKYKENGQDDSSLTETEFSLPGSYIMDLQLTSSPLTLPGDKYTEYTLTAHSNTFTITAVVLDLVIGNDYQYVASTDDITELSLTVKEPAPETVPELSDIFPADPAATPPQDVIITFTNTETGEEYVSKMPDAFGKYEITIDISEGFEISSITDSDSDATTHYLYIVPTVRDIQAVYDDGTSTKTYYTTVTFDTSGLATPITDTSLVTTTLASSGSPKNTLPVENTDFTAPAGMTIDYWETRDADGNQLAVFSDSTVIPVSVTNQPLVIYAVYKAAGWTITFNDTKDPADAVLKYTVTAGKSIADGGVTAKNGTDLVPGVDEIPVVLPEPSAFGTKIFLGWSETEITEENLSEADFETGDYAGTVFIDAGYTPAEGVTEVNVYAVYATSSDATLASVEFKKTVYTDTDTEDDVEGTYDPVGDPLPFTKADWTAPDTPIVFVPDIANAEPDTYYLVVDDISVKKIYAMFVPTRTDSTVKVTVGTTVVTDDPPAAGTQTITSDIEATTYSESTGNTSNRVEVTVTAADGETTKTYIFNVLKYKYAGPTVVLEYGNSPYGRIMKDTSLIVDGDDILTASNRQDAKDAFDTTKQYPEPDPSDPDNVQNLKYAADEYDRDEYCYFKLLDLNDDNTKLENTALVDPGFSVFDSMGRPIDFTSEDSEITIERSIEVRLFSSSFYLQEGETGVTSATYTKTGTDVFTEFADNSKIVPDAYNMIYTMIDAEGNSTELGRRKIAVVYPRGDADLSGARNILDVNAVRNDVAETRLLNKLYLYFSRIPDQDISGALNILDVNAVRNDVAETKLFIEYYKN